MKELRSRKKTLFVLIVLIGLTIPAALSRGDTFAVEYKFNPILVNDQWKIRDTVLREIPGEPLIPFYSARILLPQDAEIKDVRVKTDSPFLQEGFDILWGQPPCAFSDTPVKVGRNEDVYTSLNWYPQELYRVVSVASFRGFKILNIILYPLQYQPKSGTVKIYEKMTVEIQFSKGAKSKLYRGLQSDRQAVASIVDNADMAATYADEPSSTASPLLDPETHQYIIITNSTLAPAFEALAAHKDPYVHGTAQIVDVDWIYANYGGIDNPEKIRNFIIDAYTTWGTTYCLLGGDVSVVPYRGFYAGAMGYTDPDMASDMYFGCLDGTFNNDNDSYWAEPTDGVDWLYEVFIGRAPVETVEETTVFVNKVIAYEEAAKPEVCQFHESRLRPDNDPEFRQLVWDCEYWTPSTYEMRELLEEDATVTKTDWIDAWAGNPLVFQHYGHGNIGQYVINYVIGGEIIWYNADVSSLTNTFWPLHMSVACLSGQFEAEDCLGEVYVKDGAGPIACMLNDNYGWYSSTDASMRSGDYVESEFRALFSDGKEHLGELLSQAKSYWVSAAETDDIYRWCYYEINLLGDPETPCLTQRGDTLQPFVTITSLQESAVLVGTETITTDTYSVDTVEFYIDDVLKSTDTAALFQYAWDTTQYSNGSHTATVKGYSSGVLKDTDSVTCFVENVSTPYVAITNPKDRETVSGMCLITTDTSGVDRVEFYINGELKYTATAKPFQWNWDTTAEGRNSTILVKGYASGQLVNEDEIRVKVNNAHIALLSLLVLFLPAGICRKR